MPSGGTSPEAYLSPKPSVGGAGWACLQWQEKGEGEGNWDPLATKWGLPTWLSDPYFCGALGLGLADHPPVHMNSVSGCESVGERLGLAHCLLGMSRVAYVSYYWAGGLCIPFVPGELNYMTSSGSASRVSRGDT